MATAKKSSTRPHGIPIREELFAPYAKGKGPQFRLVVWDTDRTSRSGKNVLGYRLSAWNTYTTPKGGGGVREVLFEGEDFQCSPLHAVDSDETVRAIMDFLTLRPGDTDAEYFENYTAEQLAFCDAHAEALSFEVVRRFGES